MRQVGEGDDWMDGSGKEEEEGRWLEKSIRVGQGTETSSVGLSQLEDQEV